MQILICVQKNVSSLGEIMTLEEEYRLLISGYYGISEIDEYELKVYVLKNIEDYIKQFINTYHLDSAKCRKLAQELESESLTTKLQDSLLVLNKVKAPMELTLLVRNRLNEMKNN